MGITSFNDRTGEVSVSTIGLKMRIIKYRNAQSVDIQFEDGAKVNDRYYAQFKRGTVKHPIYGEHKGINIKAKNGQYYKLFKTIDEHDFQVIFEDGTIVKCNSKADFLKGNVENPNYTIETYKRDNNVIPANFIDRTGETNIAKNGLKMTIIRYRSSRDLDVQFEDGTVIQHKRYQQFKLGNVGHPYCMYRTYSEDSLETIESRLGKTILNSAGKKTTIVAYRNCTDMDVEVEGVGIVRGVGYDRFIQGRVGNRRVDNKDRIGESNVNTQGCKATIVEYKSSTNVIIEFEDGTRRKMTYGQFKSGYFMHPKYITYKHVSTFKNKKYFLCTCKECSGKHMLCLDDMRDFECKEVQYDSWRNKYKLQRYANGDSGI